MAVGRGDRHIDQTRPNDRVEALDVLFVSERIQGIAVVHIVAALAGVVGAVANGVLAKQRHLGLAVVVIAEHDVLFGNPILVELDEAAC